MDILIVESDAYFRKILKVAIEKPGNQVILSENGEEAWSLVNSNNIQIVIADSMISKMDGIKLCKKIREANLPRYVYFIFLTAKDQKKDRIEGLDAGADDYIVKPVDMEELDARIRAGKRIIQLEEEQKQVHMQLLQTEKMASVGQLAAGVAHEINNPTGYVRSNLKTLADYQRDIEQVLVRYRKLNEEIIKAPSGTGWIDTIKKESESIKSLEFELDIGYILKDAGDLIKESREGTDRIKKIVLDLKDFSHPGDDNLKFSDINKGLESTLNVIWNELKYKAKVFKDYGDIPNVKCYPQKINQVFMNLLVNAAQAIETEGEIRIQTLRNNGSVEIRISDTGCGIPEKNLTKIFDPFFTTKEVGKGTGLGLNMVYNIIREHNGTIDVQSKVSEGTIFSIQLPVSGIDGE